MEALELDGDEFFYMNYPGSLTITVKTLVSDLLSNISDLREDLGPILDDVIDFYRQGEKHAGIVFTDDGTSEESFGIPFSLKSEMKIGDVIELPSNYRNKMT